MAAPAVCVVEAAERQSGAVQESEERPGRL